MKTWQYIQAVFTALGGWLGWFLGGCDGLIYALIAFVVIDYITGLMCAVVNKQLSSEVGFKGIFKKVLIFMLVAVDEENRTRILDLLPGETCERVLSYMNYERSEILEGIWKQLRKAVDKDRVREAEAKGIAKDFEVALSHYTYLEE